MIFSRLTLFGVVLAFVVVGLGAFTRLVDAGLGCPDWPGCYGFLVVPHGEDVAVAEARFPDAPVQHAKAWAEMVHRYFAGALALVILVLAVMALRARHDPRMPLALPLGLAVLVAVQAAFGMWTVTLKLWPQVVTAHLLGGFTTLALLWLLFERLRPVRGVALRGHALLALAVVIAQITLGGWTSANYAALACPDFPTCQLEWWPDADFARGFDIAHPIGPNYLGGLLDNDARIAIHLSHRIGALIALLVVGALGARLLGRGHTRLGAALLAVLAAQIALGITNVVASLPIGVATAHNLGGALLLLAVVSVNYRAFRTVA